jgi:3-hydroxybutyryl-CoA dehydrogenase
VGRKGPRRRTGGERPTRTPGPAGPAPGTPPPAAAPVGRATRAPARPAPRAAAPAAEGVVAVIGAGTMGRGIAQVAALARYAVHLYDAAPAALPQAVDAIRANLRTGVERGKVDPAGADAALGRIRTYGTLADTVRDADLVIEAVPEDPHLKRRVFAALDACTRPSAVLASNTSSIRIATIADATTRPDRVLGLHFFNPAHILPLVEVVRGPQTSQYAVETALAAVRRMGKTPIVVEDHPGFASTRLGVLLGLEAMRMVEEGVASPHAIDTAMELGYRHPMGPLKLSDLIGLDVRLAIAEVLHRELGLEQYRPPEILRRLVAQGRLGKKTGAGFYRWTDDGPQPLESV